MRILLNSLIVVLLLAAVSCIRSSPPSRLYALDSAHPERMAMGTSVAVGPVKLPDYLDRPQIILRGSGNELQVLEFDRWAEPLDKAISRRIAGNLATANDAIIAYEYSTQLYLEPSYRVAASISSFGAVAGKRVELAASWVISAGNQTVAAGQQNYSLPLTSAKDVEEITELMGQLVDQFSADIAGELNGVLVEAAEELAEGSVGADGG